MLGKITAAATTASMPTNPSSSARRAVYRRLQAVNAEESPADDLTTGAGPASAPGMLAASAWFGVRDRWVPGLRSLLRASRTPRLSELSISTVAARETPSRKWAGWLPPWSAAPEMAALTEFSGRPMLDFPQMSISPNVLPPQAQTRV